jgi:ribosomal protein S18 acetylase RimI-like enzyme
VENLYRLQKHEAAQAGLVLSEAFQDDPVFNAIFEGAAPEQWVAFFTAPVVYCLKYGQAIAPSAQMEGIAAWVPGKYADMDFFRMLFSGAMWAGMKMGMEIAQKLKVIFGPVEQDRKVHMQGRDYLYLQIIGVAPQFQGQGFGKKLLNALFAESGQTGLPIYLETETDENVQIYQHLGFKVLKKATLPVIDLPMWEMIREPAG